MTLEERLSKLERIVDELVIRLEDKSPKKSVFKPPTAEDVDAHIAANYPDILPFGAEFVAFYGARGWMLGKNKIKSWKHCVSTWAIRRRNDGTGLRTYSEWD